MPLFSRLPVALAILSSTLLLGCGSDLTPPAFVGSPAVVQSSTAPLARSIRLSTNVPTRIKTTLISSSGHSFSIEFPDFATAHDLVLLGLRPDSAYQLSVLATTPQGLETNWNALDPIVTDPLPDEFPTISLLHAEPAKMGSLYTLLDARRRDRSFGAVVILDDAANVVWYWQAPVSSETERVADGTFLTLDGNSGLVQHIDMLGQTIRSWHSVGSSQGMGGSLPVDASEFHHDVIITPIGTYLTSGRDSSQTVSGFPVDENDSSVTDTVPVRDEPVVEFDSSGAVVASWPFLPMLKPTRIGYDGTRGLPDQADWVHLNGLWYDDRDDGIIASLRHQDAIVKFSRDSGELRWILGPHANWEGFEQYLLRPVGEDFYWPYHTHAPMLTREGNLLLFDNSNYQASPFTGESVLPPDENFSRAVEFSIDETTMTVQQVWEHGFRQSGERLYSSFVGDADELPQSDNVLITFGGLCMIDGLPSEASRTCRSSARIIEVDRQTHEEVFDLQITDPRPDTAGYLVYRSERLASLHADPRIRLTTLRQ